MNHRHFLAVAAMFAIGSSAGAQSQSLGSSLIDGLATCLDIKDEGQRLACSDAAARRLIDAARRKEVVLVGREEVKSTRRSLFGFSLPRIGLFGHDGPDKPEDEITQLEARIIRVADLGYGKYALTVDGGGRWNTTEAWTGGTPPNPGAMLTIKRGALGSYMVRLPGGRAVRAMRVG